MTYYRLQFSNNTVDRFYNLLRNPTPVSVTQSILGFTWIRKKNNREKKIRILRTIWHIPNRNRG